MGRHAVVIGVGDYCDRRLPPLPNAPIAAKRLSTILDSLDYVVQTLTDDSPPHLQPTQQNIANALSIVRSYSLSSVPSEEGSPLLGEEEGEGSILVFISAHCIKRNKSMFIVPQDAKREELIMGKETEEGYSGLDVTDIMSLRAGKEKFSIQRRMERSAACASPIQRIAAAKLAAEEMEGSIESPSSGKQAVAKKEGKKKKEAKKSGSDSGESDSEGDSEEEEKEKKDGSEDGTLAPPGISLSHIGGATGRASEDGQKLQGLQKPSSSPLTQANWEDFRKCVTVLSDLHELVLEDTTPTAPPPRGGIKKKKASKTPQGPPPKGVIVGEVGHIGTKVTDWQMHGLFGRLLIRALNGEAAGSNGTVTSGHLVDFLFSKIGKQPHFVNMITSDAVGGMLQIATRVIRTREYLAEATEKAKKTEGCYGLICNFAIQKGHDCLRPVLDFIESIAKTLPSPGLGEGFAVKSVMGPVCLVLPDLKGNELSMMTDAAIRTSLEKVFGESIGYHILDNGYLIAYSPRSSSQTVAEQWCNHKIAAVCGKALIGVRHYFLVEVKANQYQHEHATLMHSIGNLSHTDGTVIIEGLTDFIEEGKGELRAPIMKRTKEFSSQPEWAIELPEDDEVEMEECCMSLVSLYETESTLSDFKLNDPPAIASVIGIDKKAKKGDKKEKSEDKKKKKKDTAPPDDSEPKKAKKEKKEKEADPKKKKKKDGEGGDDKKKKKKKPEEEKAKKPKADSVKKKKDSEKDKEKEKKPAKDGEKEKKKKSEPKDDAKKKKADKKDSGDAKKKKKKKE